MHTLVPRKAKGSVTAAALACMQLYPVRTASPLFVRRGGRFSKFHGTITDRTLFGLAVGPHKEVVSEPRHQHLRQGVLKTGLGAVGRLNAFCTVVELLEWYMYHGLVLQGVSVCRSAPGLH